MKVDQGLVLFKTILTRHCLHRPPYSIFVFSEEDKTIIINFALSSFFRHYSLYEYSFKPKIDLELRTMHRGYKEQPLVEEVSHEISKMNNEIENGSQIGAMSGSVIRSPTPEHYINLGGNIENEDPNAEPIDWDKVGKCYKPESGIQ